MIKATGITKSYGNLAVLKGVDVHIKKGEVVVNTCSTPVELHLPTNTIKVSTVE